ncbi:MAG: hypothetical protein ACREQH_09635 [Candidatus Binatus sp.]
MRNDEIASSFFFDGLWYNEAGFADCLQPLVGLDCAQRRVAPFLDRMRPIHINEPDEAPIVGLVRGSPEFKFVVGVEQERELKMNSVVVNEAGDEWWAWNVVQGRIVVVGLSTCFDDF